MSAAFAAFGLTSPITQAAAPFYIGHAFKKGDVPAGSYVTTPDLTNFSVSPLRTWNDGSLKHAAIMGRVPLTANVLKQINLIATTVAPAAGTPLTAASIQVAAPSATVQCGAFGTVSLANLLASPKRTFISTKEMVECLYTAKVGTDASLYVNFHVRLFADGSMFVREVVGNGYLGGTELVDKDYVPTCVIGGLTVYSNGGISYKHYARQRYDVTGWVGSDPQITPKHDTGYLNRTKLIPNYWKGSPSQPQIDRWAATTTSMSPSGSSFIATNAYAPGNNCNFTPYMPDYGFQEHIGLLPNWEAQYCASGANPVLYRAVINNARAINSYGTNFVDATNRDPIRISDFPNYAGDGLGGSGFVPRTGRQGTGEQLVWEISHGPSSGYLAYIITADYYFLETCQMNATACWLQESTLHGQGVNRYLNIQNRARGWCYRDLSQMASIYPDALDSLFSDTKTWLKNLISAAYQSYVTTVLPAPWLGYEDLYDSRNYSDAAVLNGRVLDGEYAIGIGTFEFHFTTQAVGMGTDLEPLSAIDMPKMVGFRDYLLGAPVWITGGVTNTEYNIGDAGTYSLSVPYDGSTASLYEHAPMSRVTAVTPGDIYRATFKKPYTCFPGSADTQSYFSILYEAPCDAAVYNPTTLSSPITLVYHSDAGNGYITGFPNVPVNVYVTATPTTYAAGVNVPYTNNAVLEFSGIRVIMTRYGALPVGGTSFTITANPAPLGTGANPGTTSLRGSSGGNPQGSNGYWGNLLPALAYAVDGGKAGADASFQRFITAPNFSDQNVTANYADTPTFGIVPRSYTQPALVFTPTGTSTNPAPTPGTTALNVGHTIRVDGSSLIAGNLCVGDRGLGVLGSEVPSSGTNGSAILFNDLTLPADANKQYRIELLTVPSAGSLTLYEDSSYTFAPAGDGTYSFSVKTFEDGVYTGNQSVTIGSGVTATTSDTTAPVMNGSITPSNVGTTSFRIDWPAATDAIGVSSYEVSLNGGVSYQNIGNVLTATESGLSSGTDYQVRVQAVDAANNRATPLSLTVRTLTVGSTVTGVTVFPPTGSTLQFSAAVTGTNSPSQLVTWSTSAGSISATGLLIPPSPTATDQTVTAIATSMQDPTKYGSATYVVRAVVVTPGTKQIFLTCKDSNLAPLGALTGFGWSVFAGNTAGSLGALLGSGTGLSLNADSSLNISVPTTLAAGTVVMLALSNTTGSLTQSPAPRSFLGPVVLQ